jgi:hypothetical protein
MRSARLTAQLFAGAGLAAICLTVASCIGHQGPIDVGDPGFPFGPTTLKATPLAYVPDIKPILDADCASCHDAREAAGGYSVANYAAVVRGQRIGDGRSSLVRTCAPGGSMYPYFSGDAVTKSTAVFRWMVYYDAAQTR